MTNDEIADGFKALFNAAHENAEALPDGPDKNRTLALLNLFHAAGNVFRSHCVDGGMISPASGGEPKP